MGTQIGKGHALALTGTLVDLVSGAYYSTRVNLQSVRISTAGDLIETKDQSGEVSGLTALGDYLEAEFEVLPEGATLDAAWEGLKMPPRLTGFNASGFGGGNNLPFGPFLIDGFNSTGTGVSTDTMPWIFISGSVNGTNTGHWTMTWTMRRYKSITAANVISS